MSFQVKEILSKLNKLEREIKSIENATDDIGISKQSTRKKELLNYSCIKTEVIEFDNLTMNAGDNLLLECEVEFVAAAEQEIEISVVISGLVIAKTKNKAIIGANKLSIAQEFLPLETKKENIYVYITPLDGKQILLNQCSLNIWGGETEEESNKYNVMQIHDKFLLSFIKSNIIYYKIITKENMMLAEIDFDFCAYARDYSFAYLADDNELFLFRVDENFNLIFDNLSTGEMLFIDNNVTHVSAAFSDDKIVAAYIKNNKCYLIEMENKNTFSKSEIGYEYIIEKVTVFYNKFAEKFYLVLTLFSGKHIMLEQQKETGNFGEHLNLNYDVYAQTYEVKNEA